jgi:hypothetical protein
VIDKLEYFSGGVRVANVVTKDEFGPETVEEFLDRAKASHLAFYRANPED